MSEFFNLPVATPIGSDEMILVRERIAQRSTLESLKTFIGADVTAGGVVYSATPPQEAVLWWQLDGDGRAVDLWLRRAGDIWVSAETSEIQAFEFDVDRTFQWFQPNPISGSALWIERFTVRAVVDEDMGSGDLIDFQLSLINSAQAQTPFFFIRLQQATEGDIFARSELVNQSVSASAAMAFLLRVAQTGRTDLLTVSLAATLRRIYAPSP